MQSVDEQGSNYACSRSVADLGFAKREGALENFDN